MGDIGQFTQDIRGFLGPSLDRFATIQQKAQDEAGRSPGLGGYIQAQMPNPLDRLAQLGNSQPGGGGYSWNPGGGQAGNQTIDWLYAHGAPFTNPWAPKAPAGQDGGTGGTPQPGPAPSSAPTGGGPSTGLAPGVAQWADRARQTFGGIIDPDVMLAIMTNESGGDPNVQNHGGYPAYGLFQLWDQPGLTVDQQFQAAKQLAQQKLASIDAAYAAHGMNPDARTRARDFALAWGGHFDYDTGLPNPNSRDTGSGQTAQQLGDVFLSNYDKIKAGRQQPQAAGGGDWGGGLIGTPYVAGGLRAHPNAPQQGLDCSEFTAYVWGQKGVTLRWNAQQQYNDTARVDAGQLQPGDLVFFQGTDPSDPDYVTHVGIYVGGGKMINAQDSGVQYADLSSPYWTEHLAGYGRVAATTGGGTTNR